METNNLHKISSMVDNTRQSNKIHLPHGYVKNHYRNTDYTSTFELQQTSYLQPCADKVSYNASKQVRIRVSEETQVYMVSNDTRCYVNR